ncbi:hypothetical protein TNCV_1906441 [Trichonephila clavipes]|nr:hypothetical protein TNCV_1906441 [Trichonephila clavipes]
MLGHTQREQMSFVEASIPGCERLGRWLNIVLRNDVGTKGHGTPVEVSQSKLQSEVRHSFSSSLRDDPSFRQNF